MRWVLLYSPVYSKENEVPRNKICWKTQTRIKISKKSGSRIHALKHCVISIIFFFDKEMWETYICLRKRWLSRKWHDVFLIDFCYWSAATAKSHQSCPTLCNPIDCSPPGSHSWDSPRQEHWNGLPFPSPVHESKKWKWSRSVVSDSSPPPWTVARLRRPWDVPSKSTQLH